MGSVAEHSLLGGVLVPSVPFRCNGKKGKVDGTFLILGCRLLPMPLSRPRRMHLGFHQPRHASKVRPIRGAISRPGQVRSDYPSSAPLEIVPPCLIIQSWWRTRAVLASLFPIRAGVAQW